MILKFIWSWTDQPTDCTVWSSCIAGAGNTYAINYGAKLTTWDSSDTSWDLTGNVNITIWDEDIISYTTQTKSCT